jgi:lipoprotein-anchoring transpeptidase ErfK/SrfK
MDDKEGKITKRQKICMGIVFGLIVLFIIIYFIFGLYYTKHFFMNVKINNTDVSNMSAGEVCDELDNRAANYTLTIYERNDKSEVLHGKDFDMQLRYKDVINDIIENQKAWGWIKSIFVNTEYNLTVLADYNEDKLKSKISELSCIDTSKMESPESAYLEYNEDTGLEIVPDIKGTKINPDRLQKTLIDKVSQVEYSVDLDEIGIYYQPKIKADNKRLNDRYSILKPYLDTKITYHFDNETEILDGSIFYDWIGLDINGNVEFDEESIKEYVKELAKKYNTAYKPKTLETSYGETVTITAGSYGWLINQQEEREALLNALMSCESQDREPVYAQTAESHTGNDYGDTYVEINLSAQHLFFYKEGKLLIETDFVSGNASRGWSTPAGAYPLTYKERNATLKGENYATPVSYWMPFNGNIGLHDSTWRSSYGKNIYKKNGSHGCINLPPSAAEVIFDNIEKGMPVLCYYLEGTEWVGNENKYETVEAEPDAVTVAEIVTEQAVQQ